MELKKSEAIILRTRDFGESDLIVTLFSAHYGNLRGIAKGARRSTRRFVNSLNIFSLTNVSFKDRRNSELIWLDSCELIDDFHGIRSDYNILLKASSVVEITETLFPVNMPSLEVFELLKSTLRLFSERLNIEETFVIFQLKAMKIGGFGINLSKCSKCGRTYKGEGRALFNPAGGSIICLACGKELPQFPGMSPDTVKAISSVQLSDAHIINNLEFNDNILGELKDILKLHIEHHLGKRLKSFKYI